MSIGRRITTCDFNLKNKFPSSNDAPLDHCASFIAINSSTVCGMNLIAIANVIAISSTGTPSLDRGLISEDIASHICSVEVLRHTTRLIQTRSRMRNAKMMPLSMPSNTKRMEPSIKANELHAKVMMASR